ncbi:MAG: FKBP-type peptidyl-prolyl cis-trans isomerase [Planctomycetota bacterium]
MSRPHCSLSFCVLLSIMLPAPRAQEEPRKEVETGSGLKYSVIKGGGEGVSPKLGDLVVVHYTGRLTNGKVFDSSRRKGKPGFFALGRVIKGWNEGLALMTPGARFEFTIPPELAYGAEGRPGIPANSTLVFDVELISVMAFRKPDPEKQVKTDSGLEYEVLGKGRGPLVGEDEVFELRYAFWSTEGKLLGSSMQAGGTIKASCKQMRLPFLKEAPRLMRAGARCRFQVPAKLCFADRPGPGGLPPDSVTIWELELVRIIEPLPLPEFSLSPKEKLVTTDSGLQYEILEPGSGASPRHGQRVTVHYAGWLTNGKLFDSSFPRADPFVFEVGGRVIPGWNEGVKLMKKGSVYKFTIPAKLAYGARGAPPAIPANATLIFYIKLLEIGG